MIGDRIRKLRTQKQLTQKELGEKIGVTTSMIGMYETNDRKPSYKTLTRIAKYFKVSTDYLLGNTEDPLQFVVNDDEIPNVLKPFLQKDSVMKLTLEGLEGNETEIELSRIKTKLIEKSFKSLNALEHPEFKELLNLLPENQKGKPISVYDLFYIIGQDENAMKKLTKESLLGLEYEGVNSKEFTKSLEDLKLINDPQINAIARASQKLSPEKRTLLQQLAESMIEEGRKDAKKNN